MDFSGIAMAIRDGSKIRAFITTQHAGPICHDCGQRPGDPCLEDCDLRYPSPVRSYSGLPLIAVEPPRQQAHHLLNAVIGWIEAEGAERESIEAETIAGWYAVDLVLAGNASNPIPTNCQFEICRA